MSGSPTNPVHPRRLYLAVDCGGSKAAAAISISSSAPGQSPKFLSRGFGGAANYTDLGLEKFLVSVQQAVEAALDQARIEWRHLVDEAVSPTPEQSASSAAAAASPEPFAFPPLFHAAWLGIAGVDSPLNIAVLSPHLSKLLSIPYPSSRLIVANDTSLLAAPVMERDQDDDCGIREGVVCIAGTGSIVMSFRSRQQQQQQSSAPYDGDAAAAAAASGGAGLLEAVGRVGGFGWLLGDEAGGYMVGKKAVRAVLDQADRERLGFDDDRRRRQRHDDSSSGSSSEEGGPPSPSKHLLRDRILSHWNLSSTDDLLDTVYSNDVLVTNPSGVTTIQASQASTSAPTAPLANGVSTEDDPANRLASTNVHHVDPSQNLLPPAGRPGSGEGVDRTTSTSPIPSIPSYPSSPIAKSPLQPQSPAEPASPSTPLDAAEASLQDIAAGLAPSVAVEPPATPTPTDPAAAAAAAAGVRKLRLASLAPLVFHLAFTHGDEMSLHILRGEIRSIVSQIELLLQRKQPAHRAYRPDPFGYDARGLDGKTKDMMMLSPSRRRMDDFDSPLDPHIRRHGRLSDDDDDADGSSSADSTLMSLVVRESSKVKEKAGKLRSAHATSSANRMSRGGMGSRPGDWETPVDPRRVLPSRSTLCLGGSLLGVEGYRELLVEELRAKGWEFKRVVYIEDAARRGCEALAKGWETPQ